MKDIISRSSCSSCIFLLSVKTHDYGYTKIKSDGYLAFFNAKVLCKFLLKSNQTKNAIRKNANRSYWGSGGSSLVQLMRQMGARGCRWGGKSPNNELICLLVPVTLYSTLGFEKNIS